MVTDRPPTHPGEMLNEEYIKPMEMTQVAFAHQLGVSHPRLNDLIHARRGMTLNTALRLEQVLGASAGMWMQLQQNWDLWHMRRRPVMREIETLTQIGRVD